MGQKKNTPRLGTNMALALVPNIRSSPRKLNTVARLIRGKRVGDALNSLLFCRRRISHKVKKALQAAIDNAQNNHDLNVDRLYVLEASVGKSLVLRRFRARARGRGVRVHKYYSRLRVIVQEYTTEQTKEQVA